MSVNIYFYDYLSDSMICVDLTSVEKKILARALASCLTTMREIHADDDADDICREIVSKG